MPKEIPVVKFHKKKYGEELLIDVVSLDAIRKSKFFAKAQRHTFYSVMLTTGGKGIVEVDGIRSTAQKGLVAFSRPGDVCSIVQDLSLKSMELIFEREFVLSFFNDPSFLNSLQYFSHNRPSPFVQLNEMQYERIVGLFTEIQQEISQIRDRHLLRAMLYETLVLLNRTQPSAPSNQERRETRVSRFQELVDMHFMTETHVEFYADRLCITPNYLNRIVHQSLGQSSKSYIQARRIEEAQHLLRYTSLSVADIAEKLSFETTSYFIRTFAKTTGKTPLQFRNCPEK